MVTQHSKSMENVFGQFTNESMNSHVERQWAI